jgi:hypothetical protein
MKSLEGRIGAVIEENEDLLSQQTELIAAEVGQEDWDELRENMAVLVAENKILVNEVETTKIELDKHKREAEEGKRCASCGSVLHFASSHHNCTTPGNCTRRVSSFRGRAPNTRCTTQNSCSCERICLMRAVSLQARTRASMLQRSASRRPARSGMASWGCLPAGAPQGKGLCRRQWFWSSLPRTTRSASSGWSRSTRYREKTLDSKRSWSSSAKRATLYVCVCTCVCTCV